MHVGFAALSVTLLKGGDFLDLNQCVRTLQLDSLNQWCLIV
jgi:hypothetical protein